MQEGGRASHGARYVNAVREHRLQLAHARLQHSLQVKLEHCRSSHHKRGYVNARQKLAQRGEPRLKGPLQIAGEDQWRAQHQDARRVRAERCLEEGSPPV